VRILKRLKARLEASCARLGVPYPWWMPATSHALSAMIIVAALIQRQAMFPPALLALTALPLAATPLLWVIAGWLLPPWLDTLVVTAVVAVLLIRPQAADLAPLLLVVGACEAAATLRFRLAAAAAAPGVAVVSLAAAYRGLVGAPLYVASMVLGLEVGVTLRWQIRALNAERSNQAISQEQAVSAERQRIARDVHDVVGHSLSITLLHLTGARHALAQDADVAEAVEALTEAERVGRAAMADIRRSVGLLGSGPAATQPLPGIGDIAALVERTRTAGIDVQYRHAGDLSGLDQACGLGLYRIAQESLANIARHAPSAAAILRLDTRPGLVRLTVRNALTPGAAGPCGHGAGLAGMATRARQLGATLNVGRDGEHWLVEVTMPLTGQQQMPTPPTGSMPAATP
jgi:signal transduction histidine kinase